MAEPMRTATKVVILCKTCKGEFSVLPGSLVHNRKARGGKPNIRKYCSQKCRYADLEFYKSVRGKNNWNWKGGKTKIGEYIYLRRPEHPNRNSGDYVAEHRLVMEAKLDRYLRPDEEVHHINAIKDDNQIENLEIVVKNRHFGEVECPHCLERFKVK